METGYLSMVETGRIKKPGFETLNKLAEIYDLEITDISYKEIKNGVLFVERFCKNCYYFSKADDNIIMDKDQCRRHAPIHSIEKEKEKEKEGYTSSAVWPIVYEEHWCGEWKLKKDKYKVAF